MPFQIKFTKEFIEQKVFKKRFFEIIISYYKDFLQTTTPETDILCFLKQSFICIFYDV